jgi:hypothetical protein
VNCRAHGYAHTGRFPQLEKNMTDKKPLGAIEALRAAAARGEEVEFPDTAEGFRGYIDAADDELHDLIEALAARVAALEGAKAAPRPRVRVQAGRRDA